MTKQYIVWDHRAAGGNTDGANVLCCAKSIVEARRDIREMFGMGCIYEYDERDGELVNERLLELVEGDSILQVAVVEGRR